jgi:hypothetical protein
MPVLIACSMLEKEIKSLMERHKLNIPTVWMEKGLHEYPEKLRKSLQTEIDRRDGNETVLLSYGLCGNAVLGLKRGTRTLVSPKFDDCIRMLLSEPEREQIVVNPRCLYFTEAWISSDKFLFDELDSYFRTYGDKKGKRLAREMIKSYTDVCLIDTGLYDAAEYGAALRERAGGWDLRYGERRGSTQVLEKLLLGDWDEEFCLIGPGRTVELRDFEDRKRCVDP